MRMLAKVQLAWKNHSIDAKCDENHECPESMPQTQAFAASRCDTSICFKGSMRWPLVAASASQPLPNRSEIACPTPDAAFFPAFR